ncbi:MAG: hypothetical protein R3F65_28215, partial [bacterium]
FPVDVPGHVAGGYLERPTTYTVPGTGETRTILLHVWYPAEAVDGPHPRHHDLFEDPDAVINAPPLDPVGERYPVMVYSHGDRGFAGTSAFLMSHFARHGWLAVAPDHEGNLLTANARGELVAHYIERPADITATLDALDALPGAAPLSRGDFDRVVLTGHSRGVYTLWAATGATYDLDAIAANRPDATEAERAAFAAGLGDPRVAVAIGLAGAYREAWFGPEGFRTATVPWQVQSGTADNPDDMAAMFDLMQGFPLTWVELEGGCHQTFALGRCPTLDPALGFHIVATHALAFARHHLLGDDDPRTLAIIDGSESIDPAVTVRRH